MNSSHQHPTVNKIVNAAVPLFAAKGFAAVSVKELAEAAGVNIALISYYFGGKEKLYTYILEEQVLLVKQLFLELNAATKDPVEKLRLFMQRTVHMHKSNPYMGQIINTEQMNPTACTYDILQKIRAEIHGFLQACMKEAIAEGKFRSDLNPAYASMALGGIMHVFFSRRHHCTCMTMSEEEGEEYVKEGMELFFYGAVGNTK